MPWFDGLSVEHVLYAVIRYFVCWQTSLIFARIMGIYQINYLKTVMIPIPKKRTGDLDT